MYRLVLLFSALVACSFSFSAVAQPTLSAPVDLSTVGARSSGLSIAVSSDGTKATAVWLEASGSGNKQVKSSSATISSGVASWGATTTLSSINTNAVEAVLKVSADGAEALAVWQGINSSSNGSVMEASSASIVGNAASWGNVIPLSTSSNGVNRPRVALSADGTRAFAVWERYPPASSRSSCRVVVGRSAAISGSTAAWGSAQQISDQGTCVEEPELGMSSSGGLVTVVWSKASTGGVTIIRTRTGTVSGTTASWGGITDLSAPGFSSKNAAIAVSADGTKATVVWARAQLDDTGRAVAPILIRSRSATISGNTADWGATTVLSSASESSGDPRVGLSTDGSSVTASWIRRFAATTGGVAFALESSSGSVVGNVASWGARTNISGDVRGLRVHSLTVSGDGSKALSTWVRALGSKLVTEGASSVINGSNQLWDSVFTISPLQQSATGSRGVFSDDGSLALLGWSQDNGAGKYIARASVAEFVHPTPTPTPVATSTPTSTPTPAPTTTPVGTLSALAPLPSTASNDHHVVLRLRDYPNNFRRDYFGYLLRASDNKVVRMGKFKVRKHIGRLEFHNVRPGVYRTFTVVTRSKFPTIISSRQRTIIVK